MTVGKQPEHFALLWAIPNRTAAWKTFSFGPCAPWIFMSSHHSPAPFTSSIPLYLNLPQSHWLYLLFAQTHYHLVLVPLLLLLLKILLPSYLPFSLSLTSFRHLFNTTYSKRPSLSHYIILNLQFPHIIVHGCYCSQEIYFNLSIYFVFHCMKGESSSKLSYCCALCLVSSIEQVFKIHLLNKWINK